MCIVTKRHIKTRMKCNFIRGGKIKRKTERGGVRDRKQRGLWVKWELVRLASTVAVEQVQFGEG